MKMEAENCGGYTGFSGGKIRLKDDDSILCQKIKLHAKEARKEESCAVGKGER